MDALPALFSLAQQWVGIVLHCWVSTVTSHIIFSWCIPRKQSMYFTVEQKGPKGIAGLMYNRSMEINKNS
jgi:hypothetical protein